MIVRDAKLLFTVDYDDFKYVSSFKYCKITNIIKLDLCLFKIYY